MEAVEGDLCSLRDGDGVAARLLESVPPDTLREEREDELSWLWRLNGNCALTLTIFLLGVGTGRVGERGGRTLLLHERRSRDAP